MIIVDKTTPEGQHRTIELDTAGAPKLVVKLDGETVGQTTALQVVTPGKGYWKHVPAGVTHALQQDDGKTLCLQSPDGERCAAALAEAQAVYRAARKAQLAVAVPGLDELRAAREAEERYRDRFAAMMENEHNDGARPPAQPTTNAAALAREFPRAALYLTAEAYSYAANHHKVAAGKRAMRILADGGPEQDARKVLENWLPAERMWD